MSRTSMRYTWTVRVCFEGDGVNIRGDALGPPDAPCVLLLHGGGQTRHAWGPTGKRLAGAGFRAISLDLRGHGESDWAADEDYRVDRFVADLRKVIDTLGGEVFGLVGASMGGITSLITQGEYPASARSLVLVDIATTARPKGIERIIDFMQQKPEGFESLEEVAQAIAAYQPQRKRPPNLEGLSKNVRQGPDGRYRWHWDPAFLTQTGPEAGPLRKERLVAAASRLRVPTLLVRGKLSDVISEEDAREFQTHVPHAELVDVRDAGHMVAGDSNDVFGDAVIGFLQRALAKG